MLITLEQAKANMEIEHEEKDDFILECIEEASAVVLDYLKKDEGLWQSTAGDPDGVPLIVQRAVKMEVASYMENREGGDGPQPLSQAVQDILHRMRDPTLA